MIPIIFNISHVTIHIFWVGNSHVSSIAATFSFSLYPFDWVHSSWLCCNIFGKFVNFCPYTYKNYVALLSQCHIGPSGVTDCINQVTTLKHNNKSSCIWWGLNDFNILTKRVGKIITSNTFFQEEPYFIHDYFSKRGWNPPWSATKRNIYTWISTEVGCPKSKKIRVCDPNGRRSLLSRLYSSLFPWQKKRRKCWWYLF